MAVNFGVNYLAVIVAAIVVVIFGFIWYTPQALGRLWGANGMPPGPNPGAMQGVGGLIAALVNSFVMAVLSLNLGGATITDGIMLGVICWLGFMATLTAAETAFQNGSWGRWAVNNGHHVIAQAIIGAIVTAWR